jgi:hypothetical protein
LIENEGPVNVTVRTGTPGGGTSAAQIFSVASASPAIADVFPFFGAPAGGTEVTISGTNLESAETVLFGLNPATIMSATEDTLVVQAPVGSAGSVDVVVTTRYGMAMALGGFVYADSEPAQPWRDFGDVRVWADNFTTVEGVTTATGKVVIGNRPLNQRLYRPRQRGTVVQRRAEPYDIKEFVCTFFCLAARCFLDGRWLRRRWRAGTG